MAAACSRRELLGRWIIASHDYWDRVRMGDIDERMEVVESAAVWRQTSAGRATWMRFRPAAPPEFRDIMDRLAQPPANP